MKTEKLNFLGYCQTEGSPVCITKISNLKNWKGAGIVNGEYDQMIENLQHLQLFYSFNNDYLIFNTDTGNFFIFVSNSSIVIVEAIYVEKDFCISWEGQDFEIHEKIDLNLKLEAQFAIFDSSLTIEESPSFEGLYKYGKSDFFDLAILKYDINEVHKVSYKDSHVNFLGVRLS